MSERPDLSAAWRRELRAGIEHLREGRFAEAEVYFERAHARAPERAEVNLALGRERLRAGRLDEAETLLRRAWQLDPGYVSAAASLARCLGVLGEQHDEAHRVLAEALARHGSDPGLLVVRSEVFLEEGRVDEARRTVDEALAATAGQRRPSTARVAVLLALSRVLNAEGLALAGRSPEQALFCFKRAADLDPEWAAPVVNLGSAFARLGRAARARSAWERALALDPANRAARKNLADQRVVEARGLDDLDAAERLLRVALGIDPSHALARLRLAEVLARQARYLEAAALVPEIGDPGA